MDCKRKGPHEAGPLPAVCVRPRGRSSISDRSPSSNKWETDPTPVVCPKWNGCNAPICPLDPEMHLRSHCKDEPVCFYLREYVKPGGKGRIGSGLTGKHAEAIAEAYPIVIARWSDVRRQLERSAKTGPRLGKKPGIKPITQRATNDSGAVGRLTRIARPDERKRSRRAVDLKTAEMPFDDLPPDVGESAGGRP